MTPSTARRLAGERSPHLRQHAGDPVDWWPWCPDAFARAREADLPVLLSVGYAASQLCQAMGAESFADPGIASEVDGRFICVKVDREERPDVDQLYQTAAQLAIGRGGWPLTVFLLPDGRPFHVATWLPRESRPGQPSLKDVLRVVHEAWAARRPDLEAQAATWLDSLRRLEPARPAAPTVELVDDACDALAARFDGVDGGFGRAPKFPSTPALALIGRQARRTGEPRWRDMVHTSLERMAEGGIRDHLDGGFHRYAADSRWLSPHFEKMLPDSALLAVAYLDGWHLTGDEGFLEVARETLGFMERRLLRGDLFAGSIDADAPPGGYYRWTRTQVEDTLGPERARAFCFAYGVPERTDEAVALHLPRPFSVSAHRLGRSLEDLEALLASCRLALLKRRSERPAPATRANVVVAWNALAIRAFARGWRATGDRALLLRATETAGALLRGALDASGLLCRVIVDGAPFQPAFLDDHSFLADALLDLHEADPSGPWVSRARWLADELLSRFLDESGSKLSLCSEAHGPLAHRPGATWDQSEPSPAAVAVRVLLRLHQLEGDQRAWDAAEQVLVGQGEAMRANPAAHATLIAVADRFIQPPVTVVVVGSPEDARAEELRAAAARAGDPGAAIVCVPDDDPRLAPGSGHPLFAGRGGTSGAAAWVRVGHAWEGPVATPQELVATLRR